MIHKEICTYEVCMLAKEKGFPQDPDKNDHCLMYCWDGLRNIHSLGVWAVWYMEEYDHNNLYAAPTQSLLQRWLREEKNIHIEIVATSYGYSWIADKTNGIAITNSEALGRATNKEGGFDTFELCLEDALKYALENLT